MHLLAVNNLSVALYRGQVPVVHDLSFNLAPGEVVGLVGESGSGKSMTALSIMGLLPPVAQITNGSILLNGLDLKTLTPKKRRKLCGRQMGMVFQEPMTALNPVISLGEQVAEIFREHLKDSHKQAKEKALDVLAKVGLANPRSAYDNYPHRFSGGMRQRVVLALALALSPELILADEPTTALDPTIAMQILALLEKLAGENNSAVLFITHNLRLLANLASRIMVMYAGAMLEESPTAALFQEPLHPYSQGLLTALPPDLGEKNVRRLKTIDRNPPRAGYLPSGCLFAARCPRPLEKCFVQSPPLFDKGGGRKVRCFFYE